MEVAMDKRSAILDAAQAVIRDKGIMGTTVDDIAQRAGVAKGTVYLYFKSKEDVFVEMVVQKSAETLEAVRSAVAEKPGTWEKLQTAMRIHFASILKHMPNVMVDEGLLRLTAAQRKKLFQAKFTHVKFYEGIIADHFAAAKCEPPFSPLAGALALTAGILGYVLQRELFSDYMPDPEEYMQTYETIVHAALAGGEENHEG